MARLPSTLLVAALSLTLGGGAVVAQTGSDGCQTGVRLVSDWCQTPPPADAGRPATGNRIVSQGLTIDFQLHPYEPGARTSRPLREGETVTIGFDVRDSGSGNPASSLNPAAWLALSPAAETASGGSCADQVKAALEPGILTRPAVDLNAFYVLALNADATISVVDPVFGYGGSKLLAMIALDSPGEDWTISSDQNRVFVSMPRSHRVAVVDTRSWSITARVDTGRSPARLRLQPDEAYLWVDDAADPGANAAAGVAVVDTRTLEVLARISTGNGPHEIAFSDDSRFAYVMNADAGTVSVIDVRRLRKTRDITVGVRVSSLAYSKLAQALYVASEEAGTITAIGGATHDVIARIGAEPGLGQLRFAPGDRFGFVVNHRTNTVSVFDAALNRIVRTADVEGAPDQVSFSSRYAYIRHHDSEIVRMIPLGDLGKEAAGVPLLDFPGGQNVFGSESRTSLASAIVPAADDNAVLVANAGDKAIYYYQEGMAAPMGNFSNYGKEPLAALIVDRSLRETKPGSYRSTIRLPEAGEYRALLFINSPRVIQCFAVSIAADDDGPDRSTAPLAQVESRTQDTRVEAGGAIRIAVRLTATKTGTPIVDCQDALVLIVAPGAWQTRQRIAHTTDGIYSLAVAPPLPGVYDVYITSASLRLAYTRVMAFEVVEAK